MTYEPCEKTKIFLNQRQYILFVKAINVTSLLQ